MSDWCEIMDELHRRHREDERSMQKTVQKVREQILSQRCKFLEGFTADEKRRLGIPEDM